MKKIKILAIIAAGIATSLFTGCTNKEIKNNETAIKNQVINLKPTNLSKNVTILDLAYKNNNIMISPTSLNIALGMLTNGTNGNTTKQLEEFLQSDINNYNNYVKSYTENLEDGVNIVNSVWVSNDCNLKEEFSEVVKNYYKAKLEKLDFIKPESVTIINNWVDENTQGKIKKVLNELPETTKTVLVNVVDFDKQWSSEFEEYQITNGKFNDSNVVYLNDNTECLYYENEYATGFARNYQGDRYSFIGILPKNEGEFNISDLDIEGLLSTAKKETVEYKFPEFEFEFETSMKNYLRQLDVTLPFSLDGDFSNLLIQNGDYFVSDVIQKTKIIVNKEGTKASASTVIIVTDNCVMPSEIKQVYLDRPFAFLIYDNETNECLFIGKVVNL